MRFSRKLKRFVIIVALAVPLALAAVKMQRWDTHDFTFKSSTKHDNPFMVDFSAEVTGPDGLKFTQLGFYDGDGTWKIRLGPNTPGKWSLRTVSSDSILTERKRRALFVLSKRIRKSMAGC